MSLRLAVMTAILPLLAACATVQSVPQSATALPLKNDVVWGFENSDIPVDPAYRFGRLENGMRYVIRQNATPNGTAIVRMAIETGSLDEAESERGFAHFVEHMAFNGSTNVPEGKMISLLEREGLAFGADTNASTSFDQTIYKLDLPRNNPDLLDLSLKLMRETASELTFSPEAVEREKGVVLAEMRDRNTYAVRNSEDSMRFAHPNALYTQRLPIGTAEALKAATAESLRAFWAREYVPAHTTIVVIGDFDPQLVEAKIHERFADWRGASPDPKPDAGPVDFKDSARTSVYIDPALPERVEAVRHGPWIGGEDTVSRRQENLLRLIGYNIVNRRFLRITRQPSPPFRGAGFGTGNIFKSGRSTRLIVDTSDRKWRGGLLAAVTEYRRALRYGFSSAEVDEQVAVIHTSLQNGAASAQTRTHSTLLSSIWLLLSDGTVPSEPHEVLDRFTALAPSITPKSVLEALKRDAVPLENPLLRFHGRYEPEGGAPAVRAAWNAAMGPRISPPESGGMSTFAYTEFGQPGTVTSDTVQPGLGIRTIRFENGVMLNLKRTDLEKDRIRLKVSIDGGRKLNTRENPLVTELTPYLDEGGLGQHNEDELQTILAGRTVNNEFVAEDSAIAAAAQTTARDLELQLQLLAAYVTDPGYRSEGVDRYRQDINRYFAQLNATPASAVSGAIGGFISDNDPRFSLLSPDEYRKLTYGTLKSGITDRLKNGAIEIGIVGDFDEAQVIALVAKTFGALPAREQAFREYTDQPARTFAADRTLRTITHTGPADQALLRYTWPTIDDRDPVAALTFNLLERVVRVELTDVLRESLGKAYSPGASSSLSRYWPDYGTFSISASVAVPEVPATREAVRSMLMELRSTPISEDMLARARQPLVERYQNALKSNGNWLALVARAQSEPDQIDRFLKSGEILNGLTAQDVQDAARRYLDPDKALAILALPEGAEPPARSATRCGSVSAQVHRSGQSLLPRPTRAPADR